MSSSAFLRQVQAETLRYVETGGSTELPHRSEVERELLEKDESLREKILKRAERLFHRNHLGSEIDKAEHWLQMTNRGLMALAFILGSFASLHAFSHAGLGVVNFYWLLMVLLGFNTLAMLVWFAQAVVRSHQKSGSYNWVERLQNYIIRLVSKRTNARNAELFTGYLAARSPQQLRFWQTSGLIHRFWIIYLLGGLAMVLFMLSVKQYDFIWSTTILDSTTFVRLTQILGYIPSKLGLTVPVEQEILASQYQGAAGQIGQAYRGTWASLLVASILLYGLFPRLLFYFLSKVLGRRLQNRFSLDLALPYYIELRQRLVPLNRHVGVVDPDTTGENKTFTPTEEGRRNHTELRYQLCLGVELGTRHPWPPRSEKSQGCSLLVEDRNSQRTALARIDSLQKHDALLVVAPLQRSPDRGLERVLRQIKDAAMKAGVTTNLVLSHPDFSKEESTLHTQISYWHQLAGRCGFSTESIEHWEYSQFVGANKRVESAVKDTGV